MADTSATLLLRTEPIGKLLLRYSLPAIAAMVVFSLYNIIDSILSARRRSAGHFRPCDRAGHEPDSRWFCSSASAARPSVPSGWGNRTSTALPACSATSCCSASSTG
ncbi:MAG: hypothetical protein ACLSHC_16920 [Bilophila wadsworthia]